MGTDSSDSSDGDDGDDERSSTGILPSTTGDGSRASRWTEWLLVDGDRIAIAGAVAVLVFCFLVVAEALGVVAFDDGDPVSRMASGLLAGVFSLTTIVVSINQLILSREFTTPKESRERLDGVVSFHEDVEDSTDVSTVPAEPTELLELLAVIVDDRAREVRRLAEDHPDEEFRWRAKAVTDEVIESTDSLDSSLESTDVGAFSALSATMRYDDPWQIFATRYLHNSYADETSPAMDDALSDLLEGLEFFSVAREHFKTAYMQRELTRFSRLIVVTGAVGLVAAATLGLLYGDGGGPTLRPPYLPYAASALVAVAAFPAALLVTYTLRTATVTRRTVTIGPFLAGSDPDAKPFGGAAGSDD